MSRSAFLFMKRFSQICRKCSRSLQSCLLYLFGRSIFCFSMNFLSVSVIGIRRNASVGLVRPRYARTRRFGYDINQYPGPNCNRAIGNKHFQLFGRYI